MAIVSERRIQEADVHGQTVHRLEDALEVSLLVGEELGQSLLATLGAVSQNHLTHSYDLLVVEEHVLRTCQTDTLGTELTSHLCVVGRVGIGAHLQLGVLVAEVHELLEVAAELSSLRGNFAGIHLTGGTVDGDIVAFLIDHAVDFHGLGLVVNIQGTYAGDAALTHTASHNGSVRGHTAASGENTFSSAHAGEVLGRGLDADEDHLVTVSVPSLSVVSEEHNLAAACAGRCGQTLSNHLGL